MEVQGIEVTTVVMHGGNSSTQSLLPGTTAHNHFAAHGVKNLWRRQSLCC